MRFDEIIWRQEFLEKIDYKHQLQPDEVEEALHARPLIRKQERGRRKGQDLYIAYGRTDAGRYIVVIFISKAPGVAMPISARDMTPNERSYYAAHKQKT